MKLFDCKMIASKNIIKSDDCVILYGAGEKGKEICELLVKLDFTERLWFCDIDCEKWGKPISNNVICLSIEDTVSQIKSNSGRIIYIVACIEHPVEAWDAFERLIKEESGEIRFITYFAISRWLYSNRNEFSKNKREILYTNEKEMIKRKIFLKQKILNEFQYYLDYSNDILVLQPGKVGSTSVIEMLQQANCPCFHLHTLSYPSYMLSGFENEWNYMTECLKKKVRIITLIRNPLDRDYSAFWAPFHSRIKKDRHLFKETLSLQQMYDIYIDTVIMQGDDRGYGLIKPDVWVDEFEWLDRELKKPLGIDVLSYPFDREKGYCRVKEDNIDMLIIKLEKLDEAVLAISEFAGADIKPRRSNTSENAWFSMAYRAFREEVKIDQEYVEHYFGNNEKVDHFYSNEEQKLFAREWEENIRK